MGRMVRNERHTVGREPMTARRPKDDEEHWRALMALAHGRGRSIAEVIESITGETPSEETVEAVRNHLSMAQETGEAVDIAKVVQSVNALQTKWA